jgi:Lon protease-like protein
VTTELTPMFPLGAVLFPSAVLPLHVFELRYRQLTAECLEHDRPFGVVLIERGSEVGGGDVRTNVGTLARIVQAQPFPDGRWALATVGTSRIRVVEWLDDEPYPRAMVEPFPDGEPGPGAAQALEDAVLLLRGVLARKAELGEPAAPATSELATDITLASYQAAALSPLGPADRQRLLSAPGPDARLALLRRLLEEEREYLAARLAMETGDDSPG